MTKKEALIITAILLVGVSAALTGVVMQFGVPQALIVGGVLTVWVGTVCIKSANEE